MKQLVRDWSEEVSYVSRFAFRDEDPEYHACRANQSAKHPMDL